jgi:hypothetical protein
MAQETPADAIKQIAYEAAKQGGVIDLDGMLTAVHEGVSKAVNEDKS